MERDSRLVATALRALDKSRLSSCSDLVREIKRSADFEITRSRIQHLFYEGGKVPRLVNDDLRKRCGMRGANSPIPCWAKHAAMELLVKKVLGSDLLGVFREVEISDKREQEEEGGESNGENNIMGV